MGVIWVSRDTKTTLALPWLASSTHMRFFEDLTRKIHRRRYLLYPISWILRRLGDRLFEGHGTVDHPCQQTG